MMQNHRHYEISVWRFFVHLLQHHVMVVLLKLLSELARSALYKVFAYSSCVMRCVFHGLDLLFYNILSSVCVASKTLHFIYSLVVFVFTSVRK